MEIESTTVANSKANSLGSKSTSSGPTSSTDKSQNKGQGQADKLVYFFAAGETDGDAKMKNILGGKGANLAEMTQLGIPVPPGFTISTAECAEYDRQGGKLRSELQREVAIAMTRVENLLGKRFGDPSKPLLVSVRSGARASMPGMMDTILNLGLNEQTVEGLARAADNPRFAWDSYRRFVQMYSDVVLGMNSSLLEVLLEDLKTERGYQHDYELTESELKTLVQKMKKQVLDTTGRSFPEEPWEQLWGAIGAVFRSWKTPRAIAYRALHNIPSEWGTAVNVQAMVFGNLGETSATGVCFSRNPSTGEKYFYGEYLVNAQGEDVVAGVRTPLPVSKAAVQEAITQGRMTPESSKMASLEEKMPEVYKQLLQISDRLEKHYRDMQDMEFTIESGKLYMLQTRNAKRTARAALRVAIEMMDEGLIDESQLLERIDPQSLDQLLHPTLDPHAKKVRLTRGLPASPGGAAGRIVMSSEEAVAAKERGEKVILVRVETSPEDILGMVAAQGILTTRGGMTSHAAVVARGMGKCCVAGAGEIEVDYLQQQMRVAGYVLQKGDMITLDGSTGEVFLGEVRMVDPELDEVFERVMSIADQRRELRVCANADTPKDAQVARRFGAQGIGLCRTEHMFFGADRIDVVREMIIADNKTAREKALAELLPMQRQDFFELLETMDGYPVTIRLLDPPLHEFLPQSEKDIEDFSKRRQMNVVDVRSKVKSLHEFNPMLGHRGCRLAITYPEIYRMQVQAIAEAAIMIRQKGMTPKVEIMIPLVMLEKELTGLRQMVEDEVRRCQTAAGIAFEYKVGTMIELPRAALTADQIAEHADFFSFGTNDLTQTTLGLSRDDAGRFLSTYVSDGLMPKDPFVSLDIDGVGQLVRLAVELGRTRKPDLKIGICGEHGGDPASIRFFHDQGLNYVSCSPYRVPIARLAAAQSALASKNRKDMKNSGGRN